MATVTLYPNPSEIFILTCPPTDLLVAYDLILRFFKANKLPQIPIRIKLDYDLASGNGVCGLYTEEDKYSLYINPNACIEKLDYMISNGEISYPGYPVDMSMFGVAIHEFSHFLALQLYPNIMKDFRHEFPTKRVYLTQYTQSDPSEELTELMRLYIQNPLFLKMIDEESYKFLKKHFKSPTPCTHKQAYKFYLDFPKDVRNRLERDWKILYNIESETFTLSQD